MKNENTIEKEIVELRKKIITFIFLIFCGFLFTMGVFISNLTEFKYSSHIESLADNPLFPLLAFIIGLMSPLMVITDELEKILKKYVVMEKIIKRIDDK